MKKIILTATLFLALISFSACANNKDVEMQTSSKESISIESTIINESEESTQSLEESTLDTSLEETEDESLLKLEGRISEIADEHFVISTNDGTSYFLVFEIEKRPEGLDEIKDNDDVIVYYSGEITKDDEFIGEIIKIRKN